MIEGSFEEMLSSVTSNKELMSKISQIVDNKNGEISDTLPDVLALLSKHIDKKDDGEQNNLQSVKSKTDSDDREAISSGILDNGMVKLISSLCKEISKSSKLLLAIKPYLSKGRQDTISTILKLSSLSSVLNLLG
ncbi:MAG: hypothetical protein IJ004_04595 [Clostridia bacterium]|nr:hypothetical protein [Clostridia bacterium]